MPSTPKQQSIEQTAPKLNEKPCENYSYCHLMICWFDGDDEPWGICNICATVAKLKGSHAIHS